MDAACGAASPYEPTAMGSRRGRRAERIRGTLPELLRCFVHRGAGFWGMRWCPGPPVWRWSAPGSRRPGLRGAERGDTAVGGRKTPGSTRFPFRHGAADSGWRCFPDRMGRNAPAIRSQDSRAAGRLCPDVLQFVDAEPTGSDRRLEVQGRTAGLNTGATRRCAVRGRIRLQALVRTNSSRSVVWPRIELRTRVVTA